MKTLMKQLRALTSTTTIEPNCRVKSCCNEETSLESQNLSFDNSICSEVKVLIEICHKNHRKASWVFLRTCFVVSGHEKRKVILCVE